MPPPRDPRRASRVRVLARIERPSVIHNSQDDLISFDGKFNVDEVLFVIDVGVTNHVDHQFVDGQIHGVGRSVGNAVLAEELSQPGIQAVQLSMSVFDLELQFTFARGKWVDSAGRMPFARFAGKHLGAGVIVDRWTGRATQLLERFVEVVHDGQDVIQSGGSDNRLNQLGGIQQEQFVTVSRQPLAVGQEEPQSAGTHEIDL